MKWMKLLLLFLPILGILSVAANVRSQILGACFITGWLCYNLSEEECSEFEGSIYHGADTSCQDPLICAGMGACCNPDGSCTDNAFAEGCLPDGTMNYDSFCRDVQCAQPCDCADTDGDGVPDAWDDCQDTPSGSLVDSKGCPGKTPVVVIPLGE